MAHEYRSSQLFAVDGIHRHEMMFSCEFGGAAFGGEVLLHATINASAHSDARNGLAYIYCHDPKQNYCFSLSREADSNVIEVMVADQVVHRVVDLAVVSTAHGFVATLSDEAAARLDGHRRYEIVSLPPSASQDVIGAALDAIFRGKGGLTAGRSAPPGAR